MQHLNVTSLGIVGVQAGHVHLNQTLADLQLVTVITTLNQTVYITPAPAASNPDNSQPMPIPKSVVDPAGTRPGDSGTQNSGKNLIQDIMIPFIFIPPSHSSSLLMNPYGSIGPSGGRKSTASGAVHCWSNTPMTFASQFIKNIFTVLGKKENIAAADGFSLCMVDPTPYHVNIPGNVVNQYELAIQK
ncbi:hypothetical protein H1R20_g7917, partial [Candolleomyces eurysporus]